eukprot:TRINITY_DN1284_c1_g2_i2.p1 TRINITY_DN1284_c1_g2~~TRINITY_DN1284_c1_g2_i2.p1  ORF type:complete len:784 (-),score=226.12 TRINITY_DN1284_c1_g2_i2:89-2440(-)
MAISKLEQKQIELDAIQQEAKLAKEAADRLQKELELKQKDSEASRELRTQKELAETELERLRNEQTRRDNELQLLIKRNRDLNRELEIKERTVLEKERIEKEIQILKEQNATLESIRIEKERKENELRKLQQKNQELESIKEEKERKERELMNLKEKNEEDKVKAEQELEELKNKIDELEEIKRKKEEENEREIERLRLQKESLEHKVSNNEQLLLLREQYEELKLTTMLDKPLPPSAYSPNTNFNTSTFTSSTLSLLSSTLPAPSWLSSGISSISTIASKTINSIYNLKHNNQGGLLLNASDFARIQSRGSKRNSPVSLYDHKSGTKMIFKKVPVKLYVNYAQNNNNNNANNNNTANNPLFKLEHPDIDSYPSLEELMYNYSYFASFREAMFLSRLNHPNIIKLVGIVRDNKEQMSLVFRNAGYDLSYYCSVGKSIGVSPLTLEEIKYIFHKIVRGVSYLHSLDIVHLDLKPTSILLNVDDSGDTPLSSPNTPTLTPKTPTITTTMISSPSSPSPSGGSPSTPRFKQPIVKLASFGLSRCLRKPWAIVETVEPKSSSSSYLDFLWHKKTTSDQTTKSLKKHINSQNPQPDFSPLIDPVYNVCYWSPELAIREDTGYTTYTFDWKKCDVWSLGCILAEMLRGGEPLFTKIKPKNHLLEILRIRECRPTDINNCYLNSNAFPYKTIWDSPSPISLKDCIEYIPPHYGNKVPSLKNTSTPKLEDHCLDLLTKLLTFESEKRPSLDVIMNHPFFAGENMLKPEIPQYEFTDDQLVDFVKQNCGGIY